MTVSEQIISVLDALCEKFGIAINWTEENVIPYVEVLCRKLITYEIITSIAWLVFAILMTIGLVIATKKLYPIFKEHCVDEALFRNTLKAKSNHWSYELPYGWLIGSIFTIIGLVGLSIGMIAIIMVQIGDITKCLIFPEMYVFEYLKTLM